MAVRFKYQFVMQSTLPARTPFAQHIRTASGLIATTLHSSNQQRSLLPRAPQRHPFAAAKRTALISRAASEGWWTEHAQHWEFVHNEEQLQRVLDAATNLVLVDCFTPWCGGCKMIDPQLSRMAMDKDMRKKCTFVKIDTDEMKEWAGKEQVKTLPYFVVYRAGEGKLLGMQMSPSRMKLMRGAINTMADNRGKQFRTDPNGYVVAIESASVA